MRVAAQQGGDVAVLVAAAEEEAGHGLDLGDDGVGVGVGDVVGVERDPLGVGGSVPLEHIRVVRAVAGGVAAPLGVVRVRVLALGHGGGRDDPDAGAGAAGPLDDLAVDLGVALLEGSADQDEGTRLGAGLRGVGEGGRGDREEGDGEGAGEDGAACGCGRDAHGASVEGRTGGGTVRGAGARGRGPWGAPPEAPASFRWCRPCPGRRSGRRGGRRAAGRR